MPSVQVSQEILIKLAHHVRAGEIKTLRVKPRQNGKNKGALYADYSLRIPDKAEVSDQLRYYRYRIANIIEMAATLLGEKQPFQFEISKEQSASEETYAYRLESQ